MDRKRIERSVETLCLKGCKAVWRDIDALERGIDLQETRQLEKAERVEVLTELKAIMAVYAGKCSSV